VGFSVQQDASKQITLADAQTHAKAAFDRWSSATCASGGHPTIGATLEDPVACDQVEYSEAGPNQHAIIFRDTKWPYSDRFNTLALTTVTFDTDTGELFDADMEVNTAGNTIVLESPAPANAYDFDSIVTHEAGHFLGLAHSPLTSAVMYAFYKPGVTSLTSDDVDGICAVYAPDGARAGDIDAGTSVQPVTNQTSGCNDTPRHGFGPQCGPIGDVVTTTSSKGCSVAAPGSEPSGGGGAALFAGLAGVLGLRLGRRRGAKLPRMKRARSLLLTTLLAVGTAAVGQLAAERDASASVSIAVLFDELVRDSSAAAIMTPVEQRSIWEDGRIITYTHVHLDRTVGGTVESDPWIRTMGGAVGRIGQSVEGEAVLTVGRPALFFLQPRTESGAGVYEVTARAQGQFPVVLDEQQKERFVHASGVGALVPTPKNRIDQITRLRVAAGAPPSAQLASDVLHKRPVNEGAQEVASAWGRLHGAK
jgi:hypothetical protein